ncbi:MAG: DUF4435 domain-containing protein [Acidobacteriota bacterium]|nr:DUF4435 domain-containing protein [Acidobacteriota bacterium]
MREFITPQTIANRIRLKRPQFLGAFLIVEGDTDSRVYRSFRATELCQTVIAHNKANAVSALAILENENFSGVLAIVDADFDRLDGRQRTSPNLHHTDTHDLETLIINSPALEKILAELGSENKLASFEADHPGGVRTVLLRHGSSIGYLRWLSLRQQFNLKFESLAFSKFVNNETLVVDEAKLVKTVKDHSSAHHLNGAELQQQAQGLKSENHDLWQICCGHDLVSLLSIGLRKTLGTNDTRQVEPEVISRALRLAYEFGHFCSTQLYASVQGWQKANPSFQVFR